MRPYLTYPQMNYLKTSNVLHLGEKLTINLKDPMTVKIDCICSGTIKLIYTFICKRKHNIIEIL